MRRAQAAWAGCATRHSAASSWQRAHGIQRGFALEAFSLTTTTTAAVLADVVVVVEATVRGGARITADRAVEYNRDVLAMPGSRRNPSAAGTNALIADGAHPLLEPSDVLLALGLNAGSRRTARQPPSTGPAGAVFRACGGEAATLDQLASRTRLSPSDVAVAARELERGGWLERAQGMWWPRAG